MEAAQSLAIPFDSSSSYTRASRRRRSHDPRGLVPYLTLYAHDYKLTSTH